MCKEIPYMGTEFWSLQAHTQCNRKNPRHTARSQNVTQCWYKTPFWVPCGKELLDVTTIKYTYTGALTAIQTGCLGTLHGSQSLTALNR